jgi:hypothetical protein
MLRAIEKKILYIREQPENVRMRYLFMCLGASMFFILVIWLFSLKEAATEITKTKIPLPPLEEVKEEGKSLQSLVKKDIPLGVESQQNIQNPIDSELQKIEESNR